MPSWFWIRSLRAFSCFCCGDSAICGRDASLYRLSNATLWLSSFEIEQSQFATAPNWPSFYWRLRWICWRTAKWSFAVVSIEVCKSSLQGLYWEQISSARRWLLSTAVTLSVLSGDGMGGWSSESNSGSGFRRSLTRFTLFYTFSTASCISRFRYISEWHWS